MPVTQPVFDIEELTGFVGSDSFQFVDIDTVDIDTGNIIPQVSWECPMNMDVDEGISLDFSTSSIEVEDNHDQDQTQSTVSEDDLEAKKKEDDRWTTLFGDDFDPNVVFRSIATKTKDDHDEGQSEDLTFGKKPVEKMEAECPLKFPWDDDDEDPPVAKIVEEGQGPRKKQLCDRCGKILSSSDSLTRHHINIHLKLRRYKCDLCEKSYYDSNALKVHKAKHSGVKPFICEICDKRFFRKWDLRQHTEWHVSLYYEYQNIMKGEGCK